MARKKVEFEVTLKKHTILVAENDEELKKEIQKFADYNYYQNADSVEVKIIKAVDME